MCAPVVPATVASGHFEIVTKPQLNFLSPAKLARTTRRPVPSSNSKADWLSDAPFAPGDDGLIWFPPLYSLKAGEVRLL